MAVASRRSFIVLGSTEEFAYHRLFNSSGELLRTLPTSFEISKASISSAGNGRVLDTEFRNQTGERNELVCLAALELHTGRRLEVFFDQEVYENPLDYNGDLLVYCVASAVLTTGFHCAVHERTCSRPAAPYSVP
jgi:hypothetical protein